MRTLPLHSLLAGSGASFEQRFGCETASSFSERGIEYNTIRNSVGVTDFSHMQKYSIPEDKGIDFLDAMVAGNVAKIRFGRMLHTLLADDDGMLVADCYIANNDEELVLLCESVVDDNRLNEIFKSHGAEDAGLKDLSQSHVLISVDGYKAWSVVKELFGTDVLGLPYLSIEMYKFEGTDIRFFRAGKTSEFGYLLMAPAEVGENLLKALVAGAKKYGGSLCGVAVHNDLRLEGRFFNIFAEGLRVKDPLQLGLQWMIDFDKESYLGSTAIIQRREKGLQKKILGMRTDAPIAKCSIGTGVFSEKELVGTIQAVCFSPLLNNCVALALFPYELAYAGLPFHLGSANGPAINSISMPPIMPKSLTVKLDEM